MVSLNLEIKTSRDTKSIAVWGADSHLSLTTHGVRTCSPTKPYSSPEQLALFNAGKGAGAQGKASNTQSQPCGFLVRIQTANLSLPDIYSLP